MSSTTTTTTASASSSNTSQVVIMENLMGSSAASSSSSPPQTDSTTPSPSQSSTSQPQSQSQSPLSSSPTTATIATNVAAAAAAASDVQQSAATSSSSSSSSSPSPEIVLTAAAVTAAAVAAAAAAGTPTTTTSTPSILALPTTSSTNSTTPTTTSASPSSSGGGTTATLLSAGYRCYRHIPFPLISTTTTSTASSEDTQSNQNQSRSEYEPEFKRFKPATTSGVLIGNAASYPYLIVKDNGSVYIDSGGGCRISGGGSCGTTGYFSGGGEGENSSSIFMVHKKLEERIGGILCCTVCLDLPKTAIYQCTNGHLMCAGCFSHLLADARLKDEQATCPNCRCEISKTSCCRNLAVEKTLSELPASCAYCELMFARHALDHHQRDECLERPSRCIYECIGCTWEGPYHELDAHARQCAHPNRPAREIVEFIKAKQALLDEDHSAMSQLSSFMSLEKVCFNDLQFKQYKTDDITPKLYFETNRFTAFFHTWVLKARVNDNMKSPNLTSNRFISFQLILKSKLTSTQTNFDVKFCVLRGPFGEVPMRTRVHSFEFNANKCETDYLRLCIDPDDCNKLLASKTINFRFFMFQA